MSGLKVKVSDSLVNVPNELSQLGTIRLTDQLLELLEWLFVTNSKHETKD